MQIVRHTQALAPWLDSLYQRRCYPCIWYIPSTLEADRGSQQLGPALVQPQRLRERVPGDLGIGRVRVRCRRRVAADRRNKGRTEADDERVALNRDTPSSHARRSAPVLCGARWIR
jgi:hypothetical protein